MRKIYLSFLVTLVCGAGLLAQTGFRHQGVLRNNGNLVAGMNIGAQYLIRQTTPSGTMVFDETVSLQTDDYGVFSHTVGSIDTTQFKTIDWSQGPYFLEVIVNGTNLGTTEITKVPLAYHADNAAEANSIANHALEDLGNVAPGSASAGDFLSYDGAEWSAENPANRLPIAWGWVQAGTLNYEGFGITSISSPNAGEYLITLTSSVSGYPCIIATSFTRTGTAEITGYSADPGSSVITIKVFDAASPANIKGSDFSFVVYDN